MSITNSDNEKREEAYTNWKSDNLTDLQIEFMERYVDYQVLDDDLPDFLDEHNDEFEEYCTEQFNEADV